ncbi:UPF0389 protein CG9231 isoform X2 [Phlebotomus argentipes]|uniref:UPF0389 protein CG9231 isoform X2 n=1 Tax=Phlebotomus argentipes TaxID=94469 RepID=UPI002892D6CA|nr:UPF0389 protein CG9231 isoform X2 [Phlebotomus argentipes]
MIPSASAARLSLYRLSYLQKSVPSTFSLRYLSCNSRQLQKETSGAPASVPTEPAKSSSEDAKEAKQASIGNSYKPDNFDKRVLVWAKKYKSIEDVPNYVSREEMEKSRSKTRIRLSNWMILGTLLGCIIMVYSGKQAAERGESVSKMSLDWHAELKEQKKAEDEAALAKAYNTK